MTYSKIGTMSDGSNIKFTVKKGNNDGEAHFNVTKIDISATIIYDIEIDLDKFEMYKIIEEVFPNV